MPNENGSPVRFFLEEQVPLKEKIEEADIISLDMEPEVEIVEQDQLVKIKGDLVLSGHFQKSSSQEIGDLTEQLQLPPFEAGQLERNSQSIWSITERFPIDITVPAYKVERLDDVYLNIEQMDYRIDEEGRLNIEVELVLLGVENGLSGERQLVEGEKEQEIQTEAIEAEKGEAEERRAEDEQVEEEQVEAEQVEGEQEEEEIEAERGEEERIKEEQVEEARVEEAVLVENERGEGAEEARLEEEIEEGQTVSAEEAPDQAFSEETAKQEQREDSPLVNKVSHFLSKLMAKKEETPQKATLKICIVQRNETLEQIAERYQVSPEEIIRFNRLSSSEVQEGEMIYIPQRG